MMLRTARLGVLLLAVVGILGTMTPPASADTVKEGVFQGVATTGPLGYPCTADTLGCDPVPDPEVKPGPKDTRWVNLHNYGSNVGFTFRSNTCAKVSVGKKTGATASCTIFASGTVEGFCGLSSALGTATITNPDKGTTTATIKFVGVGGNLTVTGVLVDPYRGWLTAAVVAVPPTPTSGQSCLTGNAQDFIVAGSFTLVIKTLVP